MRIGFVVNDVMTERPAYTTTLLAMEASKRGHDVHVIGVGGFALDPDDRVRALATPGSIGHRHLDPAKFLASVQQASPARIDVEALDVLVLRNDPTEDLRVRPWAQKAGLDFGRLVATRGVIVVNDPLGLRKASSRMYLQSLPDVIRPRSVVTRDRNDIRAFAKDIGRNIVLKPLVGSRGEDVFLITPSELSNLNQMIDTVRGGGYIVAQEQVGDGLDDMRLFVMNGRPLRHRGRYAAFRRTHPADDFRATLPTGGTPAKAEVTSVHLGIAEMLRPKLIEDGIFLAVLDIKGDKLIAMYVSSPGGLGPAQRFTRVNFARVVIEALERKATQAIFYGRSFDNREMATL